MYFTKEGGSPIGGGGRKSPEKKVERRGEGEVLGQLGSKRGYERIELGERRNRVSDDLELNEEHRASPN